MKAKLFLSLSLLSLLSLSLHAADAETLPADNGDAVPVVSDNVLGAEGGERVTPSPVEEAAVLATTHDVAVDTSAPATTVELLSSGYADSTIPAADLNAYSLPDKDMVDSVLNRLKQESSFQDESVQKSLPAKDGERSIQSVSILAALTDHNNSGVEQLMTAMLNGETGKKFMTSFMALKARETTKGFGGSRKMKDAATGIEDKSVTGDPAAGRKKFWSRLGGSLRRKGSKQS